MGPLAENEVIFMQSGGGGGWGPPDERDPQAVLDDVKNELVSATKARQDYGVIIDDADGAVNEAATDEFRAKRRGGA